MITPRKLKTKLSIMAFAIFAGFVFSGVSLAQVTSSHVFQVTEDVRAELLLMHDQNFSMPNPPSFMAIDKRPRHVLQKAREVLLKIHSLKQLKGLKTREIPPFKVRLIEPREVKELVERVLQETRDLRVAFDVDVAVGPSLLSKGKTPSDVYANLMLLGYLIEELGIPKVVPNDIYRVAGAIVGELNMIHKKLGLDINYNLVPSKNKIPADVFGVSLQVILNLKTALKKRGLEVPGGIIPMAPLNGTITPGDVLDCMNNVLAELGAIKYATGITEATILPPILPGKTPSNVFDMITHANVLAMRL